MMVSRRITNMTEERNAEARRRKGKHLEHWMDGRMDGVRKIMISKYLIEQDGENRELRRSKVSLV